MFKKTAVIGAMLLLSACGESVHTKDWYLENDSARKERVQECRNDVALQVTPDCQNALAAQSQIVVFGK